MNREFNRKKQAAVILLALVAVCLAAGLFRYVGSMGRKEPSSLAETEMQEPETTVIVQMIPEETEVPKAPEPLTEPEIQTEPETSPEEKESRPEPEEESRETESVQQEERRAETGNQKKSSGNRPKSPAEATPPAEPPSDPGSAVPVENPDGNGECQPEHTHQPAQELPQGGDTNTAGAVYIPGFGYIENSGPVEGKTSYTDGDWNKQIGTME